MRVLAIAEKDIAAKRIAQALDGGTPSQRKVRGVTTYEARFQGAHITVIGLRGHILEVDYPKSLNNWRSIKPRDLVWAEPKRKITRHGRKIADALRTLAPDADRVVVATDYDREGELIGVEALDLVTSRNPSATVQRARFSALTDEEVQAAFRELQEVDEDLAASAETRQLLDLAWGASLTRFLTMNGRNRGEDGVLSVGRVQSPTLALLVEREREIEGFDPTPYWEVVANLQADGKGFLAWSTEGDKKERFWDRAEADRVLAQARGADEGVVSSVDRRVRNDHPPPPLNTTALVAAATNMGFTAKQALSTAEDLYTQGYISYPRTDNTVYPKSLRLKPLVTKLLDGPLGKDARRTLEQTNWRPTRGKKRTTDHPPIHPTQGASRGELRGRRWKLYAFIARRFLATLCDPARVEHLKVGVDLNGAPFRAKGKRVVSPGYREVYPHVRDDETLLPPMEEGDRVTVEEVERRDKETQPPKRYGQGSLVKEMEKRGLGTKSTRPNIIDTLYTRDYVKGNPPRPTELGCAVVDALQEHAEPIVDPEMTAELEEAMEGIAQGEEVQADVVRRSRAGLSRILKDLEEHRQGLRRVLRQGKEKADALGPCPECSEDLVVRTSRRGKRFAGCSAYPTCENSYSLPQKGGLDTTDRTCPECETPVVRILRKGRKPWTLCLVMDCDGT